MNADYRLKILITLIFIALLLSACGAGHSSYSRGNRAELTKNFEAAMAEYKAALDADPGNIEYQLKYQQARFAASFDHFQNGRRAFERDDLQTAQTEFSRALAIDPTNDLAKDELDKVQQIVLSRTQNRQEPQRNIEELKAATRTESVANQLEPKLTGPISLMMTQESRTAYETLAQLAGFNVIFDSDFRSSRITVELNDVDIFEALDVLSLQTNTFWQPINKNTILISPDNQTKRREYEEHILKTIYLTNSVTSTEITEAITALRTLLNMRFIAQSSSMNAILVRDTPDRVAIAEKIIEDIDKGKPEVVVEATLLEVDRNLLRQLGILPPQGTVLQFTAPGATPPPDGTTPTTPQNRVNLRDIPLINSGNFSINIPDTVAQFLATSNKTKLLQNPQVRATDGKLASIRIGSRVPIASGSFQPAFVGATGTPVVQFQYVDVGVNMDITPKVLLNRDVSMSVVVQVQAVAGERNIGGVLQPEFTNRQITHEIRLSEGETNILGGIISDTEAVSMNGIPGLKDIPILKYLFGQEQKRRDETEIIIVLTPHIVRMPTITATNMRGIYIGTEVNTQLRRLAAEPAETPAAATPATPSQPANAGPPPGAPSNATLTFTPLPAVLAAGVQTAVNIGVNGSDIYAADLTVEFDPTALSIFDIRDGGFLSQDGQVIALVQRIDTSTGTAHISLERPPGAAALSGTGNFLTLVLTPGSKKGESTLRIVDFRVRDARGITHIGQNAEARITVQ